MKRFICIVCLLALFLAVCYSPVRRIGTERGYHSHGIYQLNFKAQRISNNRVGNDWSITYTCKGQPIKSGFQFAYPLDLFTFLTVGVEVTDNDPMADVGTGKLVLGICHGASADVEIIVTENEGKYKGNTAVWKITCEMLQVGVL